MATEDAPWLQTALEKRRRRDEATSTHLESHLNGASVEDLSGLDDVEALSARLACGEFTAVQVTKAYIQRAIEAQNKTNCFTEIMFDDALKQARQLDVYLSTHGKPVGPLHGIPMTLKDQFNVKNYDTTLGYVGRSFQPAREDAVLVTILKNMGAIILAKTNLPQSIMWCETENPLWGLTTHPANPALTPGGSSGGESAVLSMHGSLVGWGTDIGGSVRIPANMLGLYSIKPSSARLPYEGVPVSTEGQEHVASSVGPLTRSLSSLCLVMESVINAQPWEKDPRCVPIPWRSTVYEEVQSRPLVIGLLVDDGVVRVHPPIERVVRDVARKLENAGHEVVYWDAADLHAECVAIMDAYYTADGGEDIRTSVSLAGEPYIPHVEALISRAPAISVYNYWQINRRKQAARKRYLDKWNSTISPRLERPVDVILMPTMAHVAIPHRSSRWIGYTKTWNVLDYTALTMPAGKVDMKLDPAKEEVEVYEARNDLEKWNMGLYDPVLTDGMPINVQLVGRYLEEEKVLGIAKVVEGVLKS